MFTGLSKLFSFPFLAHITLKFPARISNIYSNLHIYNTTLISPHISKIPQYQLSAIIVLTIHFPFLGIYPFHSCTVKQSGQHIARSGIHEKSIRKHEQERHSNEKEYKNPIRTGKKTNQHMHCTTLHSARCPKRKKKNATHGEKLSAALQ
jgi:hypothetical protein